MTDSAEFLFHQVIINNVSLYKTAVCSSVQQCAAALSSGALTPPGARVNGAEWTQRSTLHQLFASAQCKDSFGFETLVKEVIFFFPTEHFTETEFLTSQ